MEWKIEIRNKKGVFDPLGNGVKKDILDLGIRGIKKVNVSQVFIISGDINESDARRIAEELLADPITEEFLQLKIKLDKLNVDAKLKLKAIYDNSIEIINMLK